MSPNGRNFPNWLDAYFDYAKDGFCPDKFHRWMGISVLAAALERKVWVERDKIKTFPNIYVYLIAPPGVGKSTAMEFAVDILRTTDAVILPNKMSQASLLTLMAKNQKSFQLGSVVINQCSAYYYASEAAASFTSDHDNMISMVTELYDCKAMYDKHLESYSQTKRIPNPCLSLSAAMTFDYLKVLVNETTIHGGLASRVFYIVEPEHPNRAGKWERGARQNPQQLKYLRDMLGGDLMRIHNLKGPMRIDPDFLPLWNAWETEHNAQMGKMTPKLAALSSRKAAGVTKLAALMSVAESDELLIRPHHFERAVELIGEATKYLPLVITHASMSDRNSQLGLNQVILQAIVRGGGTVDAIEVRRAVLKNGNRITDLDATLGAMASAQMIRLNVTAARTDVELLVDPDNYL